MKFTKRAAFMLVLAFVSFALVRERGKEDQSITVLMYHNVVPDPDFRKITYSITPERFKAHMNFLKKRGYNSISFSEMHDFLSGDGELPQNPVLITFDDGKDNNYDYMLPIMKELGMKANLFLIGHVIEGEKRQGGYLGRAELQEMKESGLVEFGAHTYDLHKKTKNGYAIFEKKENESQEAYELRIKGDLESSKRIVESNFDFEVTAFAYPYGKYDDTVERIAKETGFGEIYTTDPGIYSTDSGDRYRIKRINVDGLCSAARLAVEVKGLSIIDGLSSAYKRLANK